MGALLTVRVLLLLCALATGVGSAAGRVPVWIPLMFVIVLLMFMVLPR